jgi:RNA polymerase sigma-70 factor (ECF subfamily)
VGAALGAPDAVFDAEEHVAYCFTCVGRSLDPEEQASLLLREVMGFSGAEAASALGVSEPVFRHRLERARGRMREAFDGLCSLVDKGGVCYQCRGLREGSPEGRRGGPLPELATLDARLGCVRRADVDRGRSQPLHDLFWRRTRDIEEEGSVSDEAGTDCGQG